MTPINARVAGLDWPRITADLDARGCANTGALLTPSECQGFAEKFEDDAVFRNRVVMQQRGYGQGEYRYFAYPLPGPVVALRSALYPHLAEVANRWEAALGRPATLPATHAEYVATCHAAGQTRPTPLLLRYGAGDYNCLHQDLYGALAFPLQVAFLLSRPHEDFSGGEFVLTEQRPRLHPRALLGQHELAPREILVRAPSTSATSPASSPLRDCRRWDTITWVWASTAYHGRLKEWMRRFQGAATENLPRHLSWRRTLEALSKDTSQDAWIMGRSRTGTISTGCGIRAFHLSLGDQPHRAVAVG